MINQNDNSINNINPKYSEILALVQSMLPVSQSVYAGDKSALQRIKKDLHKFKLLIKQAKSQSLALKDKPSLAPIKKSTKKHKPKATDLKTQIGESDHTDEESAAITPSEMNHILNENLEEKVYNNGVIQQPQLQSQLHLQQFQFAPQLQPQLLHHSQIQSVQLLPKVSTPSIQSIQPILPKIEEEKKVNIPHDVIILDD